METMLAVSSTSTLALQLAELMMRDLVPCDLGDGIEVVHDVEAVEIEMECSVDDAPPVEPAVDADLEATLEGVLELWLGPTDPVDDTERVAREPFPDDAGTYQFVRHSAPYERIEIQLDANAYVRATIEDARSRQRALARA